MTNPITRVGEAARERVGGAVARLDEGVLLVRDSRFGRYREHLLEGELARILDACHGGLRQEEIGKAAGLGAEPVRRGLSRLLEDKLVFQTEDFYLTLALRPRQELVDAFLAAEAAGRLPAAQAQPQPAAQP